jgi:integrase
MKPLLPNFNPTRRMPAAISTLFYKKHRSVKSEYQRKGLKSFKSVKQRWGRRLRPFFQKLPVDDLTTDLVQRYCAKRKAEGAANGTVNREGELLGLKVKQVDLSNRTIRLEAGETKNGAARVIKLTQEVGTLLAACCIGKKPDDFVFSRDSGKAVGSFRKVWKTVCTRAGVPDLLFHDLRRSGVRNLRRLGVQESVAMKISGHKTRSVFERGNIVDAADLAEAARKLDEKKSDAPEFGHSLGIVAENSTKNEAAAHLNLTAAVLPN